MTWEAAKVALTGFSALTEVSNVDADYQASGHYSQYITLNPGETAVLQLECVFPSGFTNDLYFRIVGSLDATSDTPDSIGYTSGSIGLPVGTLPLTGRRTITVSGLNRFRIEFRKGGTGSGTYTPVGYYRKNGISV